MNYPIFEFYYPDKKIRQNKVLIPTEIYAQYNAIEDRQAAKRFLKQHTRGMEWFIPNSPFHKAIETGIVDANGMHPVIITRLP